MTETIHRKRLWRGLSLLSLALLTATVLTATANAAPSAPPAKPARLDYKVTTLPNGLKVVTLEDHRAPVVTLQVWYRVGSADEAPGKAGFAHMFEHLMFKGTENVGAEQHARYVEALGGDYNANTSFDRTLYYETVPSNALDRMLWLEAERMRSQRVDEANLRSERDVVKEEHRSGVDNAPYGKLLENLQALLFPAAHPYAHTTIGKLEDLDRAKLEEIRAFHAEYYKPDNATLVLVGDFNTGEALDKIRRYYGPIPRSTRPFTRYPARENAPRPAAERRGTWYDAQAPLPAVGMAYRLPASTDPDTPVFDVIAQILSEGQSSRLYRSLVRDKQLAVQAQGGNLTLKHGGFFYFFAIANAGKSPADVEKALQEQVDRLRNEPVAAAELEKAKNQALTGHVFGMVSTEQKASALGEADLLYGTPEEANRAYEKLVAVTAADIQRVARKYFTSERQHVFAMLPEAMRPKTGAASPAGNSATKEGK